MVHIISAIRLPASSSLAPAGVRLLDVLALHHICPTLASFRLLFSKDTPRSAGCPINLCRSCRVARVMSNTRRNRCQRCTACRHGPGSKLYDCPCASANASRKLRILGSLAQLKDIRIGKYPANESRYFWLCDVCIMRMRSVTEVLLYDPHLGWAPLRAAPEQLARFGSKFG